jgi:2,5-dihydroxypyridine 5,6-dioxygenase
MAPESVKPDWLNAFIEIFSRCAILPSETVIVLAETHSKPILIQLAQHALNHMNAQHTTMAVPTPPAEAGPIIRSSGASLALTGQSQAVEELCQADVIIDLTVEGLMHAKETPRLLKSGARILNVSNEHPEALSRLVPDLDLKDTVKAAVRKLKQAKTMHVESEAGTQLSINMTDASTVGIWGWTDRPGTLAHWPGGLVVSFPAANSVNGQLVLAPGDVNLTFKRYLESAVTLTIENDYVVDLQGLGADCVLMRKYLADFHDKAAYATSHVGWGLNPLARYEALTMYDKADTNGTELRAVAGNFLYSTGANEFAGRFTRGHFDLPVMGSTISLDGAVVVDKGVPIE